MQRRLAPSGAANASVSSGGSSRLSVRPLLAKRGQPHIASTTSPIRSGRPRRRAISAAPSSAGLPSSPARNSAEPSASLSEKRRCSSIGSCARQRLERAPVMEHGLLEREQVERLLRRAHAIRTPRARRRRRWRRERSAARARWRGHRRRRRTAPRARARPGRASRTRSGSVSAPYRLSRISAWTKRYCPGARRRGARSPESRADSHTMRARGAARAGRAARRAAARRPAPAPPG